MAIDLRYNVYISTSQHGPWTLANTTPIVHDPNGNQHTINDLSPGVTYWFLVVGGYVDGNDFVPLISQAIGPDGAQAVGVSQGISGQIFGRVFAPKKPGSTLLGHRFGINGITIDSNLGHRFNVKLQFTEKFEDNAADWNVDSWGADQIYPTTNLSYSSVTFSGVGQTTIEDFENIEAW
jgi:hypothetical protein